MCVCVCVCVCLCVCVCANVCMRERERERGERERERERARKRERERGGGGALTASENRRAEFQICSSYYHFVHVWTWCVRQHRLAGLVIKAPISRAAELGFNSRFLRGDFFGSSHTSDLKIGTPVATLPGT